MLKENQNVLVLKLTCLTQYVSWIHLQTRIINEIGDIEKKRNIEAA